MIDPRILPYYHPTTVFLVDDNENFLHSFTLQLPESLAWIASTSARKSLDFINRAGQGESLERLCISLDEKPSLREQSVLRMDFTIIEKEISNPERFGDISVVVVDYDMPEMNGLDLLRRIDNPRVKKILLTGVADEKVAVEAFNEGIIDRFFKKNSDDIGTRLNDAILAMQKRYFLDISRTIQNTMALSAPEFLGDRAILELFSRTITEKGIVEYYYVESPRGLLMLDETGSLYRLVVAGEKDLEEMRFRLRGCNAPEWVLERLADGKHLPCFWSLPQDPREQKVFDWEDGIYPAEVTCGNQKWRHALIADGPADIEYDPAASSYARYLERLGHRFL